jgi:hypothetical protein
MQVCSFRGHEKVQGLSTKKQSLWKLKISFLNNNPQEVSYYFIT